jgi:hypothetical protein
VNEWVQYGPEPLDVAPEVIMGMVAPRWSPDHRWIAFCAGLDEDQYGVYVVSSKGGRPREVVPIDTEMGASGPADFRWSPNSKHLVYTESGVGVAVVDLHGRENSLTVRWFDEWNSLWADWQDANRLAIIGFDQAGRLVLAEVDVRRGTARLRATLASAKTGSFGAELSGNRQVIAWWASPETESAAATLSTIRTDGTGRRLVGRFRGLNAAIPDYAGSRLAIVSSKGLYLARGMNSPVLLESPSRVWKWGAPAWSPNNAKLAYLRNDGIWMRDLQSGTKTRVQALKPSFNYSLDW